MDNLLSSPFLVLLHNHREILRASRQGNPLYSRRDNPPHNQLQNLRLNLCVDRLCILRGNLVLNHQNSLLFNHRNNLPVNHHDDRHQYQLHNHRCSHRVDHLHSLRDNLVVIHRVNLVRNLLLNR